MQHTQCREENLFIKGKCGLRCNSFSKNPTFVEKNYPRTLRLSSESLFIIKELEKAFAKGRTTTSRFDNRLTFISTHSGHQDVNKAFSDSRIMVPKVWVNASKYSHPIAWPHAKFRGLNFQFKEVTKKSSSKRAVILELRKFEPDTAVTSQVSPFFFHIYLYEAPSHPNIKLAKAFPSKNVESKITASV